MRLLRNIRRLLVIVVALGLVVLFVPRMTTWVLARGDVAHEPADLEELGADEDRAALVFGAGLVGGKPSALLQERVDAAVELLEQDRVDLLVMSGDNSTEYHDEATAMRIYAIEQGAPPELVAADYAGRRTWDSCVRARDVFGMEDVVVVTSAFHVDRAIAACRAAGIDTVGFSVDDSQHRKRNRLKWRLRELVATSRGLVDAWILHPEPAVGGERIDPYDPCELLASFAPSLASDPNGDFAEFDCG